MSIINVLCSACNLYLDYCTLFERQSFRKELLCSLFRKLAIFNVRCSCFDVRSKATGGVRKKGKGRESGFEKTMRERERGGGGKRERERALAGKGIAWSV
jgi:hypothetical protein